MSLDTNFAISDLHLGHTRILLPEYDGRPYTNISEHDRDLTRACVAAGRSNRTLWILGDVAQTREQLTGFLDALRPHWGKLILIRGNHDDKVAWRLRDLFDEAHESRYVRISKEHRFYLSHYAHRTWRNSHHGAYHLHGHSHGALPRWGRSMDVGANCIDYKPISFGECVEQMKDAPSVNHHPTPVDTDAMSDAELRAYVRNTIGLINRINRN